MVAWVQGSNQTVLIIQVVNSTTNITINQGTFNEYMILMDNDTSFEDESGEHACMMWGFNATMTNTSLPYIITLQPSNQSYSIMAPQIVSVETSVDSNNENENDNNNENNNNITVNFFDQAQAMIEDNMWVFIGIGIGLVGVLLIIGIIQLVTARNDKSSRRY